MKIKKLNRLTPCAGRHAPAVCAHIYFLLVENIFYP